MRVQSNASCCGFSFAFISPIMKHVALRPAQPQGLHVDLHVVRKAGSVLEPDLFGNLACVQSGVDRIPKVACGMCAAAESVVAVMLFHDAVRDPTTNANSCGFLGGHERFKQSPPQFNGKPLELRYGKTVRLVDIHDSDGISRGAQNRERCYSHLSRCRRLTATLIVCLHRTPSSNAFPPKESMKV